jgi:hypothetical protein
MDQQASVLFGTEQGIAGAFEHMERAASNISFVSILEICSTARTGRRADVLALLGLAPFCGRG